MAGLVPDILFAAAKRMRGSSPHKVNGRWLAQEFSFIFSLPRLDRGKLFAPTRRMPSGFCYIMTNRPRGVLYVGSTTNLPRRAYEHRMGLLDGFTSRYGLTRLVHCEEFALFMDAVRRERAIKHWPRQWKIELVEKGNQDWADLYDQLL